MPFYSSVIISIILDWISKFLSESFLVNKKISIIYDFFTLQLSKNSWIAFSIPIEWIVLKIITVTIICWILFYYFKFEDRKNNAFIQAWYGLIIGWAIWNAIERIFIWKVTDFINIKYFAIFNFADIFINIWVIILLLLSCFLWMNQKKVLKSKKI